MHRGRVIVCLSDPSFLSAQRVQPNHNRITAKDTKAGGIPWLFAPILGINTQPLWSRSFETFGEVSYSSMWMTFEVLA